MGQSISSKLNNVFPFDIMKTTETLSNLEYFDFIPIEIIFEIMSHVPIQTILTNLRSVSQLLTVICSDYNLRRCHSISNRNFQNLPETFIYKLGARNNNIRFQPFSLSRSSQKYLPETITLGTFTLKKNTSNEHQPFCTFIKVKNSENILHKLDPIYDINYSLEMVDFIHSKPFEYLDTLILSQVTLSSKLG